MKANTCLLVRNQVKAQALSCLDPRETEMGFRIRTLVTYRGISVSGKWLESKGISLFFDGEIHRAWKGRKLVFEWECPPTSAQLIPLLEEADKVLLFHSIACQALRLSRRAKAASAAREAAREAASDAAWAAWDAARAAREVAWEAAREAAWAAREVAWDAAWEAAWAAWEAARLRKQVEVDEQ